MRTIQRRRRSHALARTGVAVTGDTDLCALGARRAAERWDFILVRQVHATSYKVAVPMFGILRKARRGILVPYVRAFLYITSFDTGAVQSVSSRRMPRFSLGVDPGTLGHPAEGEFFRGDGRFCRQL